jgi:putative hydrolase of the HAD superfamily
MAADSGPATVFVDADNTLWDTDAVFARAQLALLASIEQATDSGSIPRERLPFIREIDQQLAERHHQGLRYPPRLLARAAAFALMGFSAARAAKAAWLGEIKRPIDDTLEVKLEQAFLAEISRPPELRPGVIEGLGRLLESRCVVLIVTESARAKVAATAELLGLTGHFNRIIEGKKRPELYERIVRLAHMPTQGFMVGDQLDRDIAPAKTAGLTTIYFPSGFKPRWMPDEADVRPDFKIVSFAEVPQIVARSHEKSRFQRQVV